MIRAVPARSGTMVRLRDDSGVVAIVVALSVSTFLLGFAALAVDLGVAYTRKAQVQSVADRLAVATAQSLPAVSGANADGSPGALSTFRTQWQRLCQADGDGAGAWDGAECPGVGWATDNNRANGEVEFFNDSDARLTYTLPNAPGARPASATAVRVDLPPSTVTFGFGAVFGPSSTAVQKAASARIGTPLGSGILPLPVTGADVSNGQFCVVDSSADPDDFDPPTPSGSPLPVLLLDPSSIPFSATADPDAPVSVELTLRVSAALVFNMRRLTVYHSRSATGIPVPDAATQTPGFGYTDFTFTVKLPRQDPGSGLKVWVRGQEQTFGFFGLRWRRFTTAFAELRFQGYPAPDVDPCTLTQAKTRGFTPITRSAGGSTLSQLEGNVRTGPEPQLYPSGFLSTLVNPLSDLCGTTSALLPSACLTQDTTTTGFGDAIRDGLLDDGGGRDGRLIGDCGNGTISTKGYSGIDASRLMSAGSSLVDPSFGTGAALRLNIETGDPVQQGWVTAKALRCPRMAVLPVVSNLALPTPAAAATVGGRAITGFVYVWIDGLTASRGLAWNGSTLRSVSGYLIDPGYLPPVVAGSLVVGPYLGDGMPKEATLICDLGDRKLGRCA